MSRARRAGGVVLCGGRSSRMGRPKAWLPFAGELLLPRVVRILRDVVDPVVVVAASGQDVPPLPGGVEVVRDDVEGRGPLQGIVAGLAALEGRVNAAYVSACDVPLLKPAFVRRVVELLAVAHTSGASHLAVPHVAGRPHPLAAAYHVSALPHLLARLAADQLRLTDLLDAIPTRVIEPHELADVDPAFDSLRNVNTPEDYAAALAETS